jgi:nicotinamidase-related amidase
MTDPESDQASSRPLAALRPGGWDAFLTDRDRAVFAASGWGRRGSLGRRPALLVIDMTNGFCGDRPEPILESMVRWRTSCGEEAWDAIPHVNRLCSAARASGLPVIFTKGAARRPDGFGRGQWAAKNSRQAADRPEADDLVAALEVEDTDIVIPKTKPSAFIGTPLLGTLIELGADSLVVCGATTSGCVRGTVVDAFSYNYPIALALEATVDRGQASHWISLFDMDMKYADVRGVDDLISEIAAIDTRAEHAGDVKESL